MNYHKGRSSHVKGKDDLWDFAIASRGEQGLLLETLKIRLDKAMETQCTSPLGTEWISHWVSLCMFPYSFVTLPVYFQSKSSFVFPGHPSWLSVPPLFPCRKGAVFDSWCQLSSNSAQIPGVGAGGADEGRSDQLQAFLLLSLLQAWPVLKLQQMFLLRNYWHLYGLFFPFFPPGPCPSSNELCKTTF